MKQSVDKAPEENNEGKKRKKPSRRYKMLILFRELFFSFLIIYTTYAALLNSQTKTKKGAPSVPFFGNTIVDDFYQGDLTQLMYEVNSASYSFVFFYAPWDADCQDLKYEFLETAELYMNQVYFAGVNCWEPGSECRTRFKDVVERYPQLIAYVGLERAIEYKGPRKADHMIKFVNKIIHPLTRLNSFSDMWRLRFTHDAVLIGFLNINGPYDTGLKALYETALSLASRDYSKRFAVAVYTHTKFNHLMDVYVTPTIHLYIWNRKFEYDGPLKRGPLFMWVMETVKGRLVSTEGLLLLKPPTVVMFTPMHPLSVVNPSYLMLKRVAMTSRNAIINGTLVYDLILYITHTNPAQQVAYYEEFVKEESERQSSCSKVMSWTPTCSVAPKWNNATCSARSPRRLSAREEIEYLSSTYWEEECKLLDRTPLLPSTIPTPAQAITLNTTFGFACLDSSLFRHLAEALGIDLSLEPDDTAIVIIGEEEMVKVPMPDERSLWLALKDWTRGRRERAIPTLKPHTPSPPVESDRVYLPELTSSTFNDILNSSMKHSLVLYHSRYCGACARASHIMLEVASLLNSISCLSIARIDGDKVDIPWHFSIHFFPALLFIPGLKKSESRLFPADRPWLFISVTNFIVANLDIVERPEVMLAFCARWGQYPEKSIEGTECIRETRKASVKGIEMKLKEARRQRDRKFLLVQLGFLKAIHLALARVTDINKTLTIMKSLSKEFRIGCSVI